jgi:clan AA aspartic protease (TIGR02281 family)
MAQPLRFNNYLVVIFSTFFVIVSNFSFSQTIVKMEKRNGVYYVPCKVNGLNLSFIFDTGAGDVSISLTEANFMIKNGQLKKEDILGTEYYRIANGDLAEGTKIIIRRLEIGGLILGNIEASIVHTLNAPLLLGQSVLQKLGKFSFDYANNTLSFNSTVPYANKPTILNNENFNNTSITSIKIGSLVWAKENLNTQFFKNGELIMRLKTARNGKDIMITEPQLGVG